MHFLILHFTINRLLYLEISIEESLYLFPPTHLSLGILVPFLKWSMSWNHTFSGKLAKWISGDFTDAKHWPIGEAIYRKSGVCRQVPRKLPGFSFNWSEPIPVKHCWYVCIVMFCSGEVHWYFVFFMYSTYCSHAALDSGQSCRPRRYLSKKDFFVRTKAHSSRKRYENQQQQKYSVQSAVTLHPTLL